MAENARLEFNDSQGRRVVRVEKDVFTVGRRAGNDLQLAGAEISRDHAEIVRRDGHYAVRDLESRYGTFVNGERVTERELVQLDRLRFGVPPHVGHHRRRCCSDRILIWFCAH